MLNPSISIFSTYYFDPGYLLKTPIIKPILVDTGLPTIANIEYFEDSGDNLAKRSKNFGESSIFYWVWKNQAQSDYLGVWAYRRFLNLRDFTLRYDRQIDDIQSIPQTHGLTPEFFGQFIRDFDVIVPLKRSRDQSIYDHYAATTRIEPVDMARGYIGDFLPEYLDDFDAVFQGNSLFWWHIFVAKKQIFCDFCAWLFPILFYCEKKLDIAQNPDYQDFHKRALGYLTERLWNVFLHHHQHQWRMHQVGFSHVKVISPNDLINPSLKK